MDSWEVKRWLRLHLGSFKLYHLLRYSLNRRKAEEVIRKYGHNVDSKLLSLMKFAWINYHWNFDEFFLYDFMSLNHDEISSFVTEYDKNIFCDVVNDNTLDLVFHDKWQTYLKFNNYFCRDVCLLSNNKDLNSEAFISFIKKHNRFILKPVNAATGKGIEVVDCKNQNDCIRYLNTIIDSHGPCVAEELINQHQLLAEYHPSSVNTVRITTFRYDSGDIDIIHPFIKFGQNGAFVDNGGQGGIICKIDPDTGIIIAAVDETPKQYIYHPDTNKKILGFKIPFWNEAVKLAKELSNVIPQVRYVGWDLALTDAGWVMVEGNEKGMFIGFQLPTLTGFRTDFDSICNKAKVRI